MWKVQEAFHCPDTSLAFFSFPVLTQRPATIVESSRVRSLPSLPALIFTDN